MDIFDIVLNTKIHTFEQFCISLSEVFIIFAFIYRMSIKFRFY